MTKIAYKEFNFRQDTLDIIAEADQILADYQGQGYTLTLRQLYYQFVSKDLIPNNQKSYDRLGRIVSQGRLSGMLSWTAIEDRNRTCSRPFIQDDVNAVLDGIEHHYSPDLWDGQENYIEVWVEKDALAGVIQRPADRWRVAHMACKGYLSSSEAWRAAGRFRRAERDGKTCHLIHLGDHDPSGMDMTRDNGERLGGFWADVEVHRIALNYDQVEQYNPPPNPAKLTDSRVEEYVAEFGYSSWELDALEPAVISDLIDEQIRDLIDVDLFNEKIEDRDHERETLRWISENSERVFDFARREMDL